MDKVNFEDGQLVTQGYVEIDGVQHNITEAVYEGNTPLSAFNLNKLQNNIEKEINSHIEHKYIEKLTTSITAEQLITVPANYKVGANVLDVYLNGEKLIKATSLDTEGNYYEVGEVNSISKKIRITSDWEAIQGDVFEFVIRGEYSDTSE